MHNLAAYSLQAELAAGAAETRLSTIDQMVDEWLQKKGVDNPKTQEGTFKSFNGDGEGKFTRVYINTAVGSLREVQLIESVESGQIFTTTIQAAYSNLSLVVFATLAVTSVSSVVTQVQLYPRCPKVIRGLIDSFDDWCFGGRRVPSSIEVDGKGEANALILCNDLRDTRRNLPTVVISVDADEVVWPNLPHEMARDLVGLAQVAVIDEEASWILTDELGKQSSCYLGAVRMYWPPGGTVHGTNPIKGTVWTATQLHDSFNDAAGMKRFLSIVRRTVMSAAALTVAPPRIVREINNAATRERLKALDTQVRDKELDAIVEENTSLVYQINSANQEIASLKAKIVHLQDRLGHDMDENEGFAEDSESGETHVLPMRGEIRHYKKIGNKGGVDTLVVTQSCNHNESSWKSAFKAIQAEKGLAKLEGRNDWKSVQHCSACTGGGRWRVQW